MTIQHSTAVRNARADAFESTIGVSAKLQLWSGSVPANCAAAATGTKLAEFSLPSDWMAAASGGAKAFNAITGTTAITGGTVGYYRITDSAGTTCHEQGNISGDGLTIDNAVLTTGQAVNVTSWTKTEAGA